MSEPVVTYCPECATPARVQVPEARRLAAAIREWCWNCRRFRTMAIKHAKAPVDAHPKTREPHHEPRVRAREVEVEARPRARELDGDALASAPEFTEVS